VFLKIKVKLRLSRYSLGNIQKRKIQVRNWRRRSFINWWRIYSSTL